MNKPKMIIFDLGHTLIVDIHKNIEKGIAELNKYQVKNPNNYTDKDIIKQLERIEIKSQKIRSEFDYDISFRLCHKSVFEYLGIEYSLSLKEQEEIIFKSIMNFNKAQNADELLNYLKDNNIRIAILTNNMWSREIIEKSLLEVFPSINFEFIISSCDYLYRKPNEKVFQLAVNMANLAPEDIWFCGDSKYYDVIGSHKLNMFPILYQGDTNWLNSVHNKNNQITINFEYKTINDYLELIEIIENIN